MKYHALSFPVWLIACADMNMSNEDAWASGADYDTSDSMEYPALDSLRLDVRPSGDSNLEPQSFNILDVDDTDNLVVNLAPTIELTGFVTGYDATPPADPTVPGTSEVPVLGRVQARIPNTIAENSVTTSEEDGSYSLRLPAGTEYEIAVVPIEPTNLPFDVWSDEDLAESRDTEFSLGYGYPVYGVVEQNDDSRLPSTGQLYLIDPATGIEGARTNTGSDGHYMLRAHPGEYTLVFEGDDASYLPRVESTITVSDEFGARQDLDIGLLSPVEVSGRVIDANGQGVKDAIVRFTSLSLENAYGQSTVETETDQSGLFSRNLLPGTWYAQFIPPYESDGGSSPEDIQIEVRNDNEVELGDIFLEERVLLEGYVVAPSGYPLGDVLINAVETGYNGYSYSATSGSDGYFSMRVPDVGLSVSLQPSAADLAITRYELSDPNLAPAQFELSGGTLVAGHLVDPEGNPVPFTMIEVRDDSDWLYGVTLSGDDGYFEVRISQ